MNATERRAGLLAVTVVVAVLSMLMTGTPARAESPGELTAFNPDVSDTNPLSAIVDAVAAQPDGKVLLAGRFSTVGGQPAIRIARVNADGSLDTTFTGPAPTATVRSVAVQSDGKVLIGGLFPEVVMRLNPDGSRDPGFVPPSLTPGADGVYSMVPLPSGKILIGGRFTVSGRPQPTGVARLNADGSLDASFTLAEANDGVRSLAVQSDGKILVGGGFTTVANVSRTYVARLMPDGALDVGYTPPVLTPNPGNPSGTSGVYAVAVQPDGRALAAGRFLVSSGSGGSLVRLDSNGSLDVGFQPGIASASSSTPVVRSVVTQPDGRILLAGKFIDSVGGQPTANLARVHQDAVVDTSFAPTVTPTVTSIVYSLTLQPDGQIVFGGDFTTVNGQTRNKAARVLGSPPAAAPTAVTATAGVTAGAVTAAAEAAHATVSWTAVPGQISSYTATATPGGATCTTALTTCEVTGLTIGETYTFTVTAANAFGSGPASVPSDRVTPVVPPTPTPTPTPTPSPTPSPTPTPSDKTTVVVRGLRGKTVPANERTVLVRRVRTDGKVTRVRASCELHGNRLRPRVAERLCDLSVVRKSAKKGNVRISAKPTCTQGLRIHAVINAKKAGAQRTTWRKTWRGRSASPIVCRISGTG